MYFISIIGNIQVITRQRQNIQRKDGNESASGGMPYSICQLPSPWRQAVARRACVFTPLLEVSWKSRQRMPPWEYSRTGVTLPEPPPLGRSEEHTSELQSLR